MKKNIPEETIKISSVVAFSTYLAYLVMIMIGHVRDFFGSITGLSRYIVNRRKGYAVALNSWESFFTRRMYHKLQDCWNRPISSGPGCYIDVMERASTDNNCTLKTTGKIQRCLNLGSYNYLGFADDWRKSFKDKVVGVLDEKRASMCSARMDLGNIDLHEKLERTVAKFVGKESAIVLGMGYGTNASVIPALMGPGSLIISDSLNHTSIVNGARRSGALIRVFRHNKPEHLNEILREAILKGQPRFHRPWKKILVMVEGVYSMEGEICRLPEIVKVCKNYRVFLYVDEAHSIGALGSTGRGICEHCGVNPDDIDILMGTFTKSFSGMGGYIASSNKVINFLKAKASGCLYANSMSPVICQQILTAFDVIMGEDGTDLGRTKIDDLRNNSNYLRSELIKMGLTVLGEKDSPIIPFMIYIPSKVAAVSRECLAKGLALVVVGFPATTIVMSRARICISASHTKEDLDFAIKVINEVANNCGLKYGKSSTGFISY